MSEPTWCRTEGSLPLTDRGSSDEEIISIPKELGFDIRNFTKKMRKSSFKRL